ncbi:hypothetical protein [Streptosporangium sp. CA-115845]|uniref:hypothetical protein n=1 Tax=Streptosporangium sp. CA-115845 TaxID=3240071 RepID=UPI003D92A11F
MSGGGAHTLLRRPSAAFTLTLLGVAVVPAGDWGTSVGAAQDVEIIAEHLHVARTLHKQR